MQQAQSVELVTAEEEASLRIMDSQLSNCWKLYYQAKQKLFLLLKQHNVIIGFKVERRATSHEQKVASHDQRVCEEMLRELAVSDDDEDDNELMVDG